MYLNEFLLLKPAWLKYLRASAKDIDWFVLHIDGLMQKRHNSIANVLELRLFALGL